MCGWWYGQRHGSKGATVGSTIIVMQFYTRCRQLRTFRVRMCKPHVLGKPTGLAANGTYRELYVFFVLSNLTS